MKKTVNYAESSDDDQDPFENMPTQRTRRRIRNRAPVSDDEDDYQEQEQEEIAEDDEGNDLPPLARIQLIKCSDMDDFVVSDNSDAETVSKKRKRPAAKSAPRKRNASGPVPQMSPRQTEDDYGGEDLDIDDFPEPSTAQKWKFDPNAPLSSAMVVVAAPVAESVPKGKVKAHTKEPDERYPWLANMVDDKRNPPGHPDYNPATVYIPPKAWKDFSPFEKQYWDIKKNLWNVIVFFKKGKFYELYENDATIGHQLFDFKMTDRVNMRMAGVPEGSIDIWINQFIAKGYKVARVEQTESALGKEMREREDTAKAKKADKIIHRELSCILTGGTLVEGSMLQSDLATYCAAIKETVRDGIPTFGICFVDCATSQFFISEFQDDADLTIFETFVAQTQPRELLLEKSCISQKAMRILKNNTGPTTIWNHLLPKLEFWEAEFCRRELEEGGYFKTEDKDGVVNNEWPEALLQAADKPLAMSALGALVMYLRTLKMEDKLLSLKNFSSYNPIHRDGTLILEGQTLINLEIFANTANGSTEGTLFALLDKCATPFGKRLLRQWICHPLCDIKKLNERFDAVDLLNADISTREQFSAQMTKMPDLERLISRIHAGNCRPDDFVKVLDGYEQIDYTMSLLKDWGGNKGILGRLVDSMPNLRDPLEYWKTAFDRSKAKSDKIFVPERGIENDFDESDDNIQRIKQELDELLQSKKQQHGCKTLKFTDVGKEIFQIEAPKSLKVPKDWRQMSSTSSVKRYYFRELTDLVRELQEAEETHSQILKEVASRFFHRFDYDYETWLLAIRIIAQLDCLVTLAKASTSMGLPRCRPTFVDEPRSLVDFEELRHPCMLNNVNDFIPNDIQLGGESAKINLLTGANAAGKSTVLRMVCTPRLPLETPD